MRHVRVHTATVSHSADKSRALADAAFVAGYRWSQSTPSVARLVPAKLSLGQIVLHHVYDAGQVLGRVASCCGARARAIARAAAMGAAFALLFLAQYALFEGDLESFLLRHEESRVPWHPLFSAVGALSVAGSFGAGYLISGWRLRYAGVALGLAMLVANHIVLPLVYRGAHFTLAWCAAMLIGLSLWRDIAAVHLPRARRSLFAAATALLLLTYMLPASAVVRIALLGSTGAVAAPFVATAWAALEGAADPLHESSSPWFQPREKLAADRARGFPGRRKPHRRAAHRRCAAQRRARAEEGGPKLLGCRKFSALRAGLVRRPAYTMGIAANAVTGPYYLQHDGPKQRTRDAMPACAPLR